MSSPAYLNPQDTAFIASRGGWMYCDDSSVKPVDAKQVIVRNIYLFILVFLSSRNVPNIGPKGIRSVLQKGPTLDYKLVIQYSSYPPCNLLLPSPACSCQSFVF